MNLPTFRRQRVNPATTLRGIAIAVLGACSVLAGCVPALAQVTGSAPADAAPRSPALILAQASPAPPAPAPGISGAPAPAPARTMGLPPVRDYEPIPELPDIYFGFGEAIIRPAAAGILNANAAWLRAHPEYLVLIEGHCDNRGTTKSKNEFNMDLGERRAQAAMNHLVAQGVDPSRIIILSYGEERPQCTEQSERCWGKNRRSRLLVKPR
jgi:peptidoglycan-associated lipoprotein